VTDGDWWQQAACRDADPDLFAYDPATDPTATAEAAKAVCAGCPVTGDCLDFAFETMRASQDLTGIYGGLTPAERAPRRPPEQPRWRWRARDPDFAASSFARAQQLGIEATARELGTTPKLLRRAWDRHGLGRPPRQARPPANFRITRQLADEAFQLARTTSITQAARRYGLTRAGLTDAWNRYGLGHPHQGIPPAELQARWNRDHWWRRDERVRRLQAAAERRQRQQLGQHPFPKPTGPAASRVVEADGRRPRELPSGRDEERER
jgi:WhiB family transcriptional regulator, redox-sensing transcriptional regulator